MLFNQDNYGKVLSGRKTNTRRPWKEGDEFVTFEEATGDFYTHGFPQRGFGPMFSVYRNERLMWRRGNFYAVQPGRGKSSGGQIKLLDIHLERLQEITTGGCILEGLEPDEGLSEFLQKVDLLERFQFLWDSINKRKGKRWADNPWVWALKIEGVPW